MYHGDRLMHSVVEASQETSLIKQWQRSKLRIVRLHSYASWGKRVRDYQLRWLSTGELTARLLALGRERFRSLRSSPELSSQLRAPMLRRP